MIKYRIMNLIKQSVIHAHAYILILKTELKLIAETINLIVARFWKKVCIFAFSTTHRMPATPQSLSVKGTCKYTAKAVMSNNWDKDVK